MPVPAIAIHGTGSTDKIGPVIDATFRNTPSHDPVATTELDWSRAAPLRTWRGLRNLARFLRWHAGNVGTVGRLGLDFSAHTLDGMMGRWQVGIHGLLRLLVAALVALWVGMAVARWVLLPPMVWYGLPTTAFGPMTWMGWATGWIGVAIGGGVVALLVLGALRLALTLSPRPGIVTFRAIVLVLLQPVMTLGLAALVAEWWVVFLVGGVLTLAAALEGGVGAAVGWVLVIAICAGLRRTWVRGSLRGPPRFVIDVFRYLGEPECRSTLQHALDETIGRAREGGGEFVLLGDGLGSIIALDSVAHSRVWRETDRVVLVTMGSPLRRFFLRFFPRTLFPEHLEDVVDLVAGRLAAFRWINVFRPWDYAGGAMGLAPFKARDISTRQKDRVLDSHDDYWNDPEVRRSVVRGLQQLPVVEPLRVPMKDAAHRAPNPIPASGAELPRPMRRALTLVVATGALMGMVWWVGTGSGLLARTAEASELLERGVVTEASATHRREAVASPQGVTYVHHWEFAFTDRAGTAQSLQADHDVSDAFLRVPPPRFDERALVRHVRSGCDAGGRRMDTPCTAPAVQIRYAPGEMTLFDLPDFPRRRFGSDPGREWLEVAAVSVGLTVLLLLALSLGARTFGILRG